MTQMFRFFESLVDPYTRYDDKDTPPSRLLPFLLDYLQPFRKLLILIVCFTVVIGTVEIALFSIPAVLLICWPIPRLRKCSSNTGQS